MRTRDLAVAALLIATVGCKGEAPAPPSPGPGPTAPDAQAAAAPAAAPAAASGRLRVVSGRKEVLIKPVLDAFTKATGIAVEAEYGETPALAARLLTEGAAAGADVFYAQESGYLGNLANAGLLAKVDDALAGQVGAAFRAADGMWLGVSGRMRVLVYNPKRVAQAELPQSLEGLADPRWKGRLGWAPENASMQGHVSVLRHTWGEARTEAWLKAVLANEPRSYPKNGPAVEAAVAGAIDIGWVNHYYLHKLKQKGPAENWSFPIPGDVGNVLMVSAVGVLKAARNAPAAFRLLEFLVSEEAQRILIAEDFEYPARSGLAAHPEVRPLSDISLAVFDPRSMADVAGTLALLTKLGIQ